MDYNEINMINKIHYFIYEKYLRKFMSEYMKRLNNSIKIYYVFIEDEIVLDYDGYSVEKKYLLKYKDKKLIIKEYEKGELVKIIEKNDVVLVNKFLTVGTIPIVESIYYFNDFNIFINEDKIKKYLKAIIQNDVLKAIRLIFPVGYNIDDIVEKNLYKYINRTTMNCINTPSHRDWGLEIIEKNYDVNIEQLLEELGEYYYRKWNKYEIIYLNTTPSCECPILVKKEDLYKWKYLEIDLSCYSCNLGGIIGHKGEKIKKIQQRYKTKFKLYKDYNKKCY